MDKLLCDDLNFNNHKCEILFFFKNNRIKIYLFILMMT